MCVCVCVRARTCAQAVKADKSIIAEPDTPRTHFCPDGSLKSLT